MNDTQFGILIATITAGLGGLVGVIKWSVGVLTTSLNLNTSAHLKSVEAMTVMSTKLDFVYQASGKVDDFLRDELSAAHGVAEEKHEKAKKMRTGPWPIRPKTDPGEDR